MNRVTDRGTTRAVLLAVLLFPVRVYAVCVEDECHQALFPCQTPEAVADAVQFCATLNNRYVYATELPARATG
ncbi:hypothetical protein BJ166DRAFT_584701, partial [Pestalotiopsis sp. NC0098]